MTKEQISHLITVMDDLVNLRDKLEETRGCSGEAKRLDTIVGKIYDLVVIADNKRTRKGAKR